MNRAQPIPVILDTDIGGDIDDIWALALLLKSPELDPRLIVSDTGDTDYRSRIVARMLDIAGRTDIPVGVGLPGAVEPSRRRQEPWVHDYPLDRYPGTVHHDGVNALIETILSSAEPITLICIGPMPNLREALRREPEIARRARFVGMHGAFHKHHATNLNNRVTREGPSPEWNVKCDIPAAQAVFAAPWREAVITPLDTCGVVMLEGERYRQLRHSRDRLMRVVMKNYDLWSPRNEHNDPDRHSSVLFDTVAVHLAHSREYLRMQRMNLTVDDQGYTRESTDGRPFDVALEWSDREAFYDELTRRLLAPDASFRLRDHRPGDEPEVFRLVREVLAGYGLSTNPRTTDADLSDIEASYTRRGGAFRVLLHHHRIVGSYGLYPLTPGVCELRKMYLDPEFKGRGLGKTMLDDAFTRARRLGFATVTLETNRRLKEAVGLYRSYGFEEVRPDHFSDRCDLAMRIHLNPTNP